VFFERFLAARDSTAWAGQKHEAGERQIKDEVLLAIDLEENDDVRRAVAK